MQPSTEAEIRRALAAGHIIEAIKLYRQAMGVGLAQAKAAVEAMAVGRPVTPPPAHAPGAQHNVMALIAAGRKLEAIKLHREATGLGLKEAKDVVDALEAKVAQGSLVVRRPGGGGGWIAIAALLAVAAATAYLLGAFGR